jgi:hypothetical protein
MERASLVHRIWFESKVPIYVERFILPILAAIVTLLVMMNSFSLRWDQRAALFVGVAAFAYLISTTVHQTKQSPEVSQPGSATVPSGAPSVATPPSVMKEDLMDDNLPPTKKPPPVRQRSDGPNSPNIVTFGPNSPVTINQRAEPWTLSSIQQRAITEAVRPYVGLWDGKSDVIICIAGDPESTQMAEAFVAAFRAAGWQLPGGGYAQGFYSQAPVGIEVAIAPVQPDAVLMQFLRGLSAALNQVGLISGAMGVRQDSAYSVGRFAVSIGRRPVED